MGGGFLVALAETDPARVVEAVMRRLDTRPERIEDVVEVIPLAGEDDIRSFAVVAVGADAGEDGRTVTAVVRGAVALDVISVGGSRRFWAAGVQPWVLAEFRNVTGLVVGADDEATALHVEPPAGAREHTGGVVAGSRLYWSDRPVVPVAAPLPVPGAAIAAETADPDDGGEAPAPADIDQTIAYRRRTAGSAVDEETRPRSEFGETVIIRPPAREPEAPDRGDAPGSGRAPATGPGPRPAPGGIPAAPPPAGADPTAGAAPEPSDPPAGAAAGSAGAAAAGAATAGTRPEDARTGARFGYRVLPGEPYDLDAPTFVGRNPRVPAIVSGAVPRIVRVPSATGEVSATHLRIEAVGDAVVATDLRSTNGTVVTAPGGAASRLRPGESRVVLPGTRLEIGDGNIIEIVPGSGRL